MKEGQEIDKLFKKRLEDPDSHLAYNEDDWDALEQMMDQGKKRPFIMRWLPILGSVAALALLFFGWWLFKADQVTVKPDNQAAVKPVSHNVNSDTIGTNKSQATVKVPMNKVAVNPVPPGISGGGNRQGNTVQTSIEQKEPTQNAGATILAASGLSTSKQKSAVKKDIAPPDNNSMIAIRNDTGPSVKPDMLAMEKDTTPPVKATDAGQGMVAQAQPVTAPAKTKVKIKSFGPNRPQFAVSVIASSDLNGVNSFQQSKVGSNFGAMFSVTLKKWTVTTGATYSIKPYATGFENYATTYQFKQNPINVTADCRMLDIPLNVGYRVYQKNKNKFSLGTGLSSYFMLHESYTYTYNAGATGPASYAVPNPKNYLLSIVNLNATFEHQVNSKFSLSVQPYMKLPISAVGYSQVNLHTAGVAVGFNWNINSFTKPK